MSGAQRHPTVQFNQRCDQLDPVVLVVCGRSWRNNIGVGGAAMCAVMGDLVRVLVIGAVGVAVGDAVFTADGYACLDFS